MRQRARVLLAASDRPGMTGIEEQQRLAGERVEGILDILTRHRGGAQAGRVAIGGEKIKALALTQHAVTGEIDQADVAAGHLLGQPVQSVTNRAGGGVLVRKRAQRHLAVEATLLVDQRRRKSRASLAA